MAYTKLKPRLTKDARVEEISRESSHYLLSISSGKANQYRLAQLDDYTQLTRDKLPLRSPVEMTLSARASSNAIPGTWGFGLWNDPFGFALGFGGYPFRLPALPNAAWFFGASEESYLSFRDPSAERNAEQSKRALHTKSNFDNLNPVANRTSTTNSAKNAQSSAGSVRPSGQRGAYNGFLAQTFRAPKFHPSLLLAGTVLPFSRKRTRRILGKIIDEDGIRLSADITQWHQYKLDWRETGSPSGNRVSFEVDDIQVFESNVSPQAPLGLVIWIDNQFAAFTPEGKIGLGVLENPEPAWLEVRDINVRSL